MTPVLTSNRKHDPRDGWYLITPPQAATLLEGAAKNRPLKEFRAKRIADEIRDGTWKANGESVIFDEKGRVNDGQHRLRGCVLANMPIEVYCVFGIPSAFFPSLDQGAARAGCDLAALMGFQNATTVAACTKLAMEYAEGRMGAATLHQQAKIPSYRQKLYMDRNRERLIAAVTATVKHQDGIRHLVPLSHAAFVYYMNMTDHETKALEFLEKLSTGAGLRKGDAILLFREKMKGLVGEKHKLRIDQKLALIIKTWNAFLADRSGSLLRWNSDTETFPRFE